MNINPKVSVVMSVYNGERYLREAVNSILNQTYRDFEFIIINDASTDGTVEILKEYESKDNRIVLIHNEKNLGLTKSLNKGIELSKGEYIARMDADDISHLTRIKKQIYSMELNPNLGLIGTGGIAITRNNKELIKFKILTNNKDIKSGLFKGNQFVHGSVVFRKICIQKVGMYREQLKCAQDYDLWLRISQFFEVANLEEILYKWRLNGDSVSVKKLQQQKYTAELLKKIAKDNNLFNSELINDNLSNFNSQILTRFKDKSGDYFAVFELFRNFGDYESACKFLLLSILYKPYSRYLWSVFFKYFWRIYIRKFFYKQSIL